MATYGTYNSPGGFKLTVYGIVIAACFLMMFYIVRGMYIENNPGRINSARAAERIKARNQLREKSATALMNGGVIDTNKPSLVRLPIARAMQMTVEAYKNPEAARSNLIARAQKAAEPVAPPSFE
jgi:hypothetical protein